MVFNSRLGYLLGRPFCSHSILSNTTGGHCPALNIRIQECTACGFPWLKLCNTCKLWQSGKPKLSPPHGQPKLSVHPVHWHENESVSRLVMPNFLQPQGLYLCPWNSAGKNTGVGCHCLLLGIFPTQGSNPGFPHGRQILYQLSHQGSPRILEWVAYPFSKEIFLTQELNQGLLHCMWILYQLSYQGSPSLTWGESKSTSGGSS